MTRTPGKPIDPDAHGIIDYAFAAFLFLVPRMLGLNPIARLVSYALGSTIGAVNALSAPKGVYPVLPFRTHGKLEEPLIPALILLPWLTGQLHRRGTRAYFVMIFGMAAVNFFLTDYDHDRRPARHRFQRPAPAREMIGADI
ncbi:MAG TPA: hypothetical protein VF624_13610 [Tepidisphaeraceae bacterium]|jgi:hypothetical protein